jgi:DNA-binding transcriptional MocR family regulator
MRKIYQERYTILRESAQQHLAEYLEIATIEAGLQTIGRLHSHLVAEGITAEMIAQRAALVDIDIVPLSRYRRSATIPEALQIGFAAVHEKEIHRGVLKLASIFDRIKAERLPATPSLLSRNLV